LRNPLCPAAFAAFRSPAAASLHLLPVSALLRLWLTAPPPRLVTPPCSSPRPPPHNAQVAAITKAEDNVALQAELAMSMNQASSKQVQQAQADEKLEAHFAPFVLRSEEARDTAAARAAEDAAGQVEDRSGVSAGDMNKQLAMLERAAHALPERVQQVQHNDTAALLARYRRDMRAAEAAKAAKGAEVAKARKEGEGRPRGGASQPEKSAGTKWMLHVRSGPRAVPGAAAGAAAAEPAEPAEPTQAAALRAAALAAGAARVSAAKELALVRRGMRQAAGAAQQAAAYDDAHYGKGRTTPWRLRIRRADQVGFLLEDLCTQ
jgi:hypothetical protein